MVMIVPQTKMKYTPEDLLSMPDGDRYELVNGELVETNVSAYACHIATRLVLILGNFCELKKIGYVIADGCTYQCFPFDPGMVRRPDVSFVQNNRWPNGPPREGHVRIAPDLAVEVVSPNDIAEDIDDKVSEYLRAGVRLVWVIHPKNRTALTYRPDGSISAVAESGTLDGEAVVPGFKCLLSELFHQPVQEQQQQ